MKNLLVTKFRGKFGVAGDNTEIDAIIREEVDTFLSNEQMSEQNLIKLDKKLSELINVKTHKSKRGNSIVDGLRHNGQAKQADFHATHSSISS